MSVKHYRYFDLAFVLIAIGELTGHLIDFAILNYLFKPLLLICLSVYFYVAVKEHYNAFAKYIQLGFFFSWVGDILLIFEKERPLFFLLGLVAFLSAHIFYILAFINSVAGSRQQWYIKKHPLSAVPFIILGAVVYYLLYPNLGDLAIPVLVYTTVIVIIVISALNRNNLVEQRSFWLIFIGAVVFMLSDSILAINKFLMPFPGARVCIMGSYIIAQYMIMKGSIRHLKNR